ncbi:hypothetical protein [Bifidobacterium longum]|uniref:hypothetical protein n=2 Tax=Bifidobacterium longum TaxID=216816 RepID=UPI00374F5351
MVELVTGHAGKAHATAEQAAGLNAGILGLDDYVLDVHDKLKITVVSANKVTIGTGELVMQGRHVSQGTPEDLIVTNGSQGQKRNDLIVCRYAKGSQSVESAKLVVVRGTPTTGTPTDPTLNTTSPLDGGTTYDMPLYRIPLDGIAIGTPVPLFNVLRPMSDVWDSLTQPLLYAKFKWQDTKSFQPDAYGGGMQIVVDERNRLLHVDLSGFKSTVNLSHDYPVFQYASGVKPSKAVSLGCLWALPVGNWAKQATWNANGTIMVVGGLSNGDRCMHTPRTLPIPDGVTFS